jgi:hypothetical protein
MPVMWSSYVTPAEFDLNCRVTKISSEQDQDNPFLWLVHVDYSTKWFDPQRALQDPFNPATQNPTQRNPEITWSFQKYQKPITTDINGAALVNSADEPFDPPVEIDDSRPALTVSRYEIIFSPALAVAYMDAVNSDPFAGALPGTAKVDSITGVFVYVEGFFLWKVTYVIHFRREGWDLQPLDAGLTEIFTGPGGVRQRRPIQDPSGQPVTAPQLLDGTGRALAQAGAPITVLGNTVVGTTTISGIADTSQIQIGMRVRGPGLVEGTTVVATAAGAV